MTEVFEVMGALRTIHGDFDDREISRDEVERILAASVRAATGGGKQSYSIIVLEDRDTMMELLGYSASRALIYLTDYNRLTALSDNLGYAYDPSVLQDYVTAQTDAVLAAQNAVIAAKSLGIDSLITNAPHRRDPALFYNKLNLPGKYCVPVLALLLGYAKEEPTHGRGRICGPGLIHYGQYRPMTKAETEEMVSAYDGLEPQMGLNPKWAETGRNHYLDWFFSVREGCPHKGKGTAPVKPGKIGEYLERAGFMGPPSPGR